MNSYTIYRITETIRIMIFIVLYILVYDFYPITVEMIILLALLNDLPLLTIAKDNAWLEPRPVRWKMRRVLTVTTAPAQKAAEHRRSAPFLPDSSR